MGNEEPRHDARVRAIAEPTSRFLESILEGVPDAVFVKDRERRYVLVNDAFVRLTGRPATAIVGHTDPEFLAENLAERFGTSDLDVLNDGLSVLFETELFVDAVNRTFHLSTTKVPLRGADGQITHVLGVVHDITRLKDAEEALRVANEGLERRVDERTEALRGAQQALLRKERLAVLGQLAGGVAHQIRNPLTAINNAASVLRRRLGEATHPDVQQALSIIREEVWEANRIITDLLDYARIRPPTLVAADVRVLLEAALSLARPHDSIVVEETIDEGLLALVDERQMRDALGNVIRNALEAMPDGGTLVIEAHQDADQVFVAIADTGPGLTRDSLRYLFEPLVTSKPLGLGLGLPTAKALIENQGGTIRCSTSFAAGARFEIRVPRAEPESRDSSEAAPEAHSRGPEPVSRDAESREAAGRESGRRESADSD